MQPPAKAGGCFLWRRPCLLFSPLRGDRGPRALSSTPRFPGLQCMQNPRGDGARGSKHLSVASADDAVSAPLQETGSAVVIRMCPVMAFPVHLDNRSPPGGRRSPRHADSWDVAGGCCRGMLPAKPVPVAPSGAEVTPHEALGKRCRSSKLASAARGHAASQHVRWAAPRRDAKVRAF